MIYTISIDWLSIFGHLQFNTAMASDEDPFADGEDADFEICLPQLDGWTYEVMPYGTRQFKKLVFVYMMREKIAEVAFQPSSYILDKDSCLVKFDNRLLYESRCKYTIERFLIEHRILVQRISRIDICADFRDFNGYDCHDFIKDFLSLKIRHIGRGNGCAYFHHRSKKVEGTSFTIANLKYSGLSFGSHDSDIHVYLYNKTKELSEVHDKPHIRDTWVAAGLVNPDDYEVTGAVDTKSGTRTFFRNAEKNEIWRLEVSIHGDGIRFKNKQTGSLEEITLSALWEPANVALYYHTFIRYYFQFIKNRDGITNVTREPRIDLFGKQAPYIQRIVLRNVSGGNATERILIHKLWQLNEEYRKLDNKQFSDFAKDMALQVADATDLRQWFLYKVHEWAPKHYKH